MNNLTRPITDNTKSNTAIICLSPYHGGMEIDAYKMAKMLSKFLNLTLILKEESFIEKKYKAELKKIGVNVETINFRKNFSCSIITNTRKIIQKNNIKNVIFFGASELKSLYFSFIGLNINLLIRHGTTKGTSKKDFFHKLIYAKVNYHIAISNHLAKNVKKIIPFGKNTQIVTIYPSLNLTPNIPKTKKVDINRTITLLHVGRIVDGKGQIDAVKACKVLHDDDKDFTLYLVGEIEENYGEKLISYINSLPYKNSIKIKPFTFDISSYYKKSDIFIFPSKGEGFGNVFMEALSYGLVCVAYNNSTFPEFKKQGFDLLLAQDQNIKSLMDYLHEALKYIENEHFPIVNNIQLSKKLFNSEREAREIMDILL